MNTVVFTPLQIGPMTLSHRIIRSATHEGLADETGAPTERLTKVYAQLAQGEVGLIVAGTAYISHGARWGNHTTGLDHDRFIEPLSQLCAAVHEAGGNIAAQLLHCGSTVNPATLSTRDALYGPSAMIDPVCGQPVTELSRRQIQRIVQAGDINDGVQLLWIALGPAGRRFEFRILCFD